MQQPYIWQASVLNMTVLDGLQKNLLKQSVSRLAQVSPVKWDTTWMTQGAEMLGPALALILHTEGHQKLAAIVRMKSLWRKCNLH